MKKKLFTVWVFSRLNTRRFFRDKLALFFGVLFPLIFLSVFGLISGKGGISFRVAVLNESNTSFAQEFTSGLKNNKIFKVDDKITNLDQAKEKMGRSQLDATIVLPKGFGESKNGHPAGQAQVVYTQNSEQAGQTLVSVLDGVFKEKNSKYVSTEMPLRLRVKS